MNAEKKHEPTPERLWNDESTIIARPSSRPSPEEVERLFLSYRSYVGKIGRRILGPSGDVEDLIQDVFVVAVQNVHTLRDADRARAWLATITTRMAKRRRFRITVHTQSNRDDPEEVVHMPSEAPSPESTAHVSGRIERLLSLPEQLRTPWMLRHVEGKTLEDIAQECDCSLSTAQRRIRTVSGRISAWKR